MPRTTPTAVAPPPFASADHHGHPHHEQQRAQQLRRGQISALHGLNGSPAPGRQEPLRCPSTLREESMITRQGRSASTVSSDLPNSDIPVRRRERHDDRPRVDLIRLLDDPASGLAWAHLLPVAGDAAARLHRAESIGEAALASWSASRRRSVSWAAP